MEPTSDPSQPQAPSGPLLIRGQDEIRDHIAALVEGAHHELAIFAPQLDPRWFNTERFASALTRFAVSHRNNRARLLIEDAEQAVSDNNRIVELSRRLSDFFEFRQVGEEHAGVRELFVLADRRSYLHQEDLTRLTAVADLHGARAAADLRLRFQAMWDRSEPIARLHTTGL